MSMSQENWDELVQGLRAGDESVVRRFWDEYGPALERIIDGRIAGNLRRRVGPEDIVQSACRTFFRRVRRGEFQLPDADSLWRLLCAIACTKVREQARFHAQQKRGVDRERHLDSLSAGGASPAYDVAAGQARPSEMLVFAEELQHLLQQLDEDECRVVELRLQDCTNDEIAERLGCSERTVRRLVKRIQTRLEQVLDRA